MVNDQRPAVVLLGNRYQDWVSGWEGVATARYTYLNGCVRYELSGVDKDGKPEAFVFDEQQLRPVGEPAHHVVDAEIVDADPIDEAAPVGDTGGPRSTRPVAR